jgi:PAS domain S-box-containing protein
MTETSHIEAGLAGALKRLGFGVALTAGGICAVAALGIWLIAGHAEAERERALAGWQTRLGIMADARNAEIARWLHRQFDTVGEIAENEAVQLYATTLADGGGDAGAAEARQGYLQNYLSALAAQAGFAPRAAAPALPANVRRAGIAGLMIVGADGRVIAATPDAPQVDDGWTAFLARIPPTSRALRDIYMSPAGTPVIGFAAPLFGTSSPDGAAVPRGFVIGVREVAGALFPLLAQPGAAEKTLEAVLVRREGAAVAYIGPLADGTGALSRRMAADTPRLAASFALDRPGGFGVFRDYAGAEVLVASRAVAGTPWVLAMKIGRDEALAADDALLQRRIALFGLLLAAVIVGLVAAWRHGASARAGDAVARLAEISRTLEDKERLLRSISDTVPDAVLLADGDARVRFANREAGRRVGVDGASLAGKSLTSAFGPAKGARYAEAGRRAMERLAPVTAEHRAGLNGSARTLQSRFVPLLTNGAADSFLMVETDVTDTVRERERREAMLDSLVAALVRLADQRDPLAAGQSARVAALAAAVAAEMGLDEAAQGCARNAGRLVNFYKILVPARVLTKNAPLDGDEIAQLQEARDVAAGYLEGIDFGAPVVETLRQMEARVDGAGRPAGLAGADILPTAQIVALANSFVAMTSDRSYRAGMPVDGAVAAIGAMAGTAFAPGAVAAFANYMENRGGRARWEAQPGSAAPT